MAPKLLSGLAKMIKTRKRRTRKTSPDTAKAKAAPPAVVAATVTTNKNSSNKPTLTVTTSGAVEASKNFGGSSTTCGSSGYLHMDDTTRSDSFLYSLSTNLNTSSTTPHTLVTVCSSEEDATSHTFCGSDSESPSALPPRPTRAKRSQSCTAPVGRRALMGSSNNHNKSLSFRLRKRNRALSDVDFDRLLTASRGWTFDPNDCSSVSSTPQHYRHDAMAQTDFERYIFAPQQSASNSRRSSAPPTMFVQVPACCLEMPGGPRRSSSCDATTATPAAPRPLRASAPPRVPAKQQEKPSNPFFLPIESCCH